MVTEDKIRTFYQAIDGSRGPLEPDDPKFVHNLYDSGDEDPIEQLGRRIENSNRNTLNYFTGQRGTGKSSQLRVLRTYLRAKGFEVCLIDMAEYVPETQPISVVSLLVTMVSSISDFAEREYGFANSHPGLVQRVWRLLQSEVKVKEIEGSAAGFKAKIALEAAPSFFDELDNCPIAKQREIITQGRALLAEFADEFRARSQKKRVIFLIDSLERLHDPAIDDKGSVTNGVISTFCDHHRSLTIDGADVLYAIPPVVIRTRDLAGLVQITEIGSVRVFEAPPAGRGVLRKEGVALMTQIVEKRFADWRSFLTSDALSLLIENSGGDVRQFLLRLLSNVIEKSYRAIDRLPFQSDDPALLNVIKRAQSDVSRIVHEQDIKFLKAVLANRRAVISERAQAPQLANLFENRHILSYLNGEAWDNVSPLLWPLIDIQNSADRAEPDADSAPR